MNGGITIVGLGEALWDLLPAGKQLGGATLNVAYHVEQLLRARNGRGVVASRVGSDPLGAEIVANLAGRGMATEFVQRDATHATGTVRVDLNGDQTSFAFVEDVAWDHLEFTPQWAQLAREATAVCFGTLAQRSATSRETIGQFLDAAASAIRLFDVNLRSPHYDRDVILASCDRATLVKLNEEELPVLAQLLGLPVGAPVYQLAQLRARYQLDSVIYTRGRRGTMIVLDEEVITPAAVSCPAATNADAVGAGDACSAGILVGWALGLPPTRIAELANHLGAFVASQPGATPELPDDLIRFVG
ncbi:MAG: PfkB family carbohydrate kinase, partial [Pirellulales bacterium]